MTLKIGFGKCSLFVLSANGWKNQNMDSHSISVRLFDSVWFARFHFKVMRKWL